MPARKKTETQEMVSETKARKFDSSEEIPCRSITTGGLYMEGMKSHTNYQWSDIGDITGVEYQDLVAAIRSNSTYVMAPYFLIEDDDLIEQYPQIKKLYDTMYTQGELSDVLTDMTPADMQRTIASLPKGAQESIKTLAARMISNGTLDSVRKIKILDEIFGLKFSFISE